MGYLSDWKDAENASERARAAHPDCDGTPTCPGTDHLLDCSTFRRAQRQRMLADIDAADEDD